MVVRYYTIVYAEFLPSLALMGKQWIACLCVLEMRMAKCIPIILWFCCWSFFPWWRQVETFSALLVLWELITGPLGIRRSSVNSPHKGQWRGALMFSLICAWTNDWANHRDPGDLKSQCIHYDVTVMHILYGFIYCLWDHHSFASEVWH